MNILNWKLDVSNLSSLNLWNTQLHQISWMTPKLKQAIEDNDFDLIRREGEKLLEEEN